MRLIVALAWLVSANLQNTAHLLPEPGRFVPMCGSDHLLFLPSAPAEKRKHGCEGACHAAGRRFGDSGGLPSDDCC